MGINKSQGRGETGRRTYAHVDDGAVLVKKLAQERLVDGEREVAQEEVG